MQNILEIATPAGEIDRVQTSMLQAVQYFQHCCTHRLVQRRIIKTNTNYKTVDHVLNAILQSNEVKLVSASGEVKCRNFTPIQSILQSNEVKLVSASGEVKCRNFTLIQSILQSNEVKLVSASGEIKCRN